MTSTIRSLRGEYPQITDNLGAMLAKFSVNGDSLSWHNAEPPPVDADAGLATNHPDLLEPASHRRFDVVIEMPMPGQMEREAILLRSVCRFAETLKPKGERHA